MESGKTHSFIQCLQVVHCSQLFPYALGTDMRLTVAMASEVLREADHAEMLVHTYFKHETLVSEHLTIIVQVHIKLR